MYHDMDRMFFHDAGATVCACFSAATVRPPIIVLKVICLLYRDRVSKWKHWGYLDPPKIYQMLFYLSLSGRIQTDQLLTI
jgi:hypothetical protein